MRKLILFVLLITGLVFLTRIISISTCAKPIHYRIETVDAQFNLSIAQFTSYVESSAQIWNKAYGSELLAYDPNGNLSVNLIYDARQRLGSTVAAQEQTLGKQQQTLDQQIAQYREDEQTFIGQLNALNTQIKDWNKKGGAPPDVYNQLLQEQKDLSAQAASLQQRAKSLNLSSKAFNTQVKALNQDINAFNASLADRPEEGVYNALQDRIEIYFNISSDELTHTIAHEFGHALGLPHNDNQQSIMNFKTNKSVVPSNEDLAALKAQCAPRTIFQIMQNRLDNILNYLKSLPAPALSL